MKWPKLRHSLSAAVLSMTLIGCGGSSGSGGGVETDPDTGGTPPPPPPPEGISFNNATVHDPSVIKVQDTYYVFGSHLAAAKSTDLMNWDRFAEGVNAANPLFDDVTQDLSEALTWARTTTLWAADVTQLEDGRFYFYYNASQGDRPRGVLGVAVSDQVEGPYEDLGIMLLSGMGDADAPATESNIGADGTPFDARIHPHTVDPHTFFDHTGKLWMVYGSYSGGIFILEMDPTTGKQLPDQGYGKHLLGGHHSRIEAPYIIYSPESEYYYLLSSYGGLSANGGYEMRVARSRNPDGPYVDGRGTDMATVRNPNGVFLDAGDPAISPHGQKQMGGFYFDREDGEPGYGPGHGYVSPGHSSAYYQAETGQYFLFFHTRFPFRGEEHEVRVHEMFINSDDWLVVSPHRYVPLSESEASLVAEVSEAEAVGEYAFIEHTLPIKAGFVNSDRVTLTADGTITGDLTGTWEYSAGNRVVIFLDGDTEPYHGVLSRQYNETLREFTVTFTAMSSEGPSIWGSQMSAAE